ncbi:MAG: TetR/AcrR family transcriptional regulator [Caulobacteraceae bacterium]
MADTSKSPAAKRYHHGDLERGLLAAGRRLLEREGLPALSMRGLAREAGVSATAPYHHFKDHAALLYAIGREGSADLAAALRAAHDTHPYGREQMIAVSVAYVEFALANPALYQLMSDTTRLRDSVPSEDDPEGVIPRLINQAFSGALPPTHDDIDRRLRGALIWATLRGLVDVARFRIADPLKELLGGERAFLEAVLSRIPMTREG